MQSATKLCARILPYNKNLHEKLVSFAGYNDEYVILFAIFINIMLKYGAIQIKHDQGRKICSFDWQCNECHKIIRVEQQEKNHTGDEILRHLKINELYNENSGIDLTNNVLTNVLFRLLCVVFGSPDMISVCDNMEIVKLIIEIQKDNKMSTEMREEIFNVLECYKTCEIECIICNKKVITSYPAIIFIISEHFMEHLLEGVHTKSLNCRNNYSIEK